MANSNIRQYILTGFLIAILFGVGFILWRYTRKAPGLEEEIITGDGKPLWLGLSIPDIDKIKAIIADPKFKELEYIKAFFEPVEEGQKGRPNPFIPFPPG